MAQIFKLKKFGLLIFIVLRAGSFTSEAQPYVDLLNIQGQLSKPIDDRSKDNTGTHTYFFSSDLSLPLKIRKDVLAIGASYSILKYRQWADREIDMNSLLLSFAWIKQWKNDKLKTSFVLIGRTNAYPKNSISSNNLQVGGAILQTIKKRQNLKYKFGIYYNSEFFGPFILPLAGIDWNINERLNLFGVLPGSMNLEYKLGKYINVGLAFRSITNSYRGTDDSFIRINDNHLKALADIYLAKKHVFTIEAGHSILRKYKPGTRISGETRYNDLHVNDGYLIKVAYAFRIRLDQEKQD